LKGVSQLRPGFGRVQAVALAFALVILTSLVLFHASSAFLSRDPAATVSPWLVRELAAIACLAAVVMALVSFGLVRKERARRRRAEMLLSRQKDAEERLIHLERFDSLTGAPKRGHFTELLRNELAQCGGRVAVLILDIDRFRYINDVFTPEAGDEMLCRVSQVLGSAVKPGGVFGRLGSDEFGLIHRCDTNSPDARALADTILEALSQSAAIGGQDVSATASIGIAFAPDDGDNAATLLRNADIALSIAKSRGRNRVVVFRQEMSAEIVELYAIQRDVAGALKRGEYQVHYQPYCELSTGRRSGAEALIRWNSEALGQVSPSKFIPALEESGLIVPVGEWILRTACRQIRDWKGSRPLPVAVNLSQIQVSHRDLVGLVTDVVRESEIDPRDLTLELTESICIHDIDFASELVTRLKSVGVSISVDDFGTGYSSLSYVKKLKVDNLKIDMSFVRDVADDKEAASIITAITSMALRLGLKTIAEGVETRDQARILHLLGCDMGQGYHFGRAMPAAAFEGTVEATPASDAPTPGAIAS
jgi:diguanylate cyclase (GGDEF)-like protein